MMVDSPIKLVAKMAQLREMPLSAVAWRMVWSEGLVVGSVSLALFDCKHDRASHRRKHSQSPIDTEYGAVIGHPSTAARRSGQYWSHRKS
jgi:hypothetical protein